MTEKTHRPCPACGKRDGRHLGAKNGFEMYSCRACRSLFTDRVPRDEEEENYDEYYTESNLTVPDFIMQRLNEILTGFEPYRQTNRILDIGFGAGSMLDAAKDLGWEVYGLEVSRPAVEQARARGYNVFHGALKDSGHPTHFFDVVTASEIIEHLPDPEADLKEIARVLRPGGLFWGTTPSAQSLSFKILKLDWSVLSPPEHIQLYSKAGARLMLTKAGFSQVRFKTYGLNPSEIVNHYRNRPATSEGFSRVDSAYRLNESLTKSPFRKLVKTSLNGILNILQKGDSLKIYANTTKS